MRNVLLFTVAGLAATSSVQVSAQATTPDQIICAMSGSCAPNVANSSQKIDVTDEKSFSLVKTAPAAGGKPVVTAPAPRTRTVASRAAMPVAYVATPRVKAGSGRMEMMVSFANGSADLTDQAKGEARSFAAAMSSPALEGMHFNIEGHTDAVGGREYNMDLSQRRAQSVVNYLVGLGVPAARLAAHGYGFDKPRAGLTPTAPGNRRVEFVKAS